MFILVFLFLLGTVETVKSDQPQVEMFTEIISVGTEAESHMILTCRAKGFSTADIILNIKKNHCVLTEEDKVETSGVKPHDDTYQREDRVIISTSDTSHYSCEVIHAASRFCVEKVWDPDSDERGQNISSKFIDKAPPALFVFATNSKVQANVFLTCLATSFYPNNITLNIRKNERILTKEDGVETSGDCSNEDNTFQRRDYVVIKKSDKSNYSCVVIHAASDSRVEKVWDHRLPPVSDGGGDNTAITIVAVAVVVLVLVLAVLLVFVFRKRIRGAAARHRTIYISERTQSESSLVRNNSSASGRSSSYVPDAVDDKTTDRDEAENLLEGNVHESEVSRNISSETSDPCISEQETETKRNGNEN